ncbi:MAG: PD-(D/E)XK nuclease family protein [Nanoarchaeota archaeon]
MPVYSYSRLNTFEQCQLKFKYRYIDKIIPDIEKSIEAFLGEIVHSTLEWLYNKIKDGRTPSIEEVINHYAKEWGENHKQDMVINKKELTSQDFFDKGVKFIIDYYMRNQPFDDNTIAIEKEIFIELDELGKYKIKGFIDRLSYNLKTEEYEIHDYKTANNLPKKEKIDEDRQLALYSIAIKEMFGEDKKICLVWHFLAHDKRICSRRTNEQLQKLKKEIINLIREIEQTEDFSPNKSILCNWCEYRTICSAWTGKPVEKQKDLNNFHVKEEISEKKT